MKKVSAVLTSAIMVLAMLFCLAGCGENPKKQKAIDAFNATSTAFNEVANLVNANADKLDDEAITTFQQMSDLLSTYKDILESDAEIEDDKYDEMIEWFGTAKKWIKEIKAELNAAFDSSAEK